MTLPATELPQIPAARARVELRIVNSRFIGSLAPAEDVAAARAFIAEIRAEMPDASHHVYAYVIGHGATTTLGMSDDGEPSGTAGRPMLAVLRGSGIGDAVVVVTRYFGGTLLGTGGLVRAYSDTTRAVLEVVPRVAKIARRTIWITIGYAAYELVRRLVLAHEARIDAEEFAADIVLLVTLPEVQVAPLAAALTEATAGRARLEAAE
ncbi:MAG TPA: YigZ family protein [Roseiflexaceae bacterium]|nr:YigZ family protein [Roseiflexaceae bacterium]HMP40292.1 YigZ family protein [Roseiflexaceae bacterium]